jgi:6-pyruvoyltetrahydropterin/6-carboxytetrahydropterin synthase
MKTSVTRRYHFESAHFLPKVREGHKCARPHGHNYEMEVTVQKPDDGGIYNDGFIIDFWDLDKVVQPLLDQVDHRMLNDIPGLENPTAELIAAWFMDRIQRVFQRTLSITNVRIFETKDCWADIGVH